VLYVGIDWAEEEHAICVLDEQGAVLAERRIPDTLVGSRELQALLASHAAQPQDVVLGIETEHGLLVRAVRLADYQLYAINPLLASRYHERVSSSGAKSDPADARMLAELVRTDRHRHRPLAGDSDASAALAVLTRAHQELIWDRQRHTNQLRSALRLYYPGSLTACGTSLGSAEARLILRRAPTPADAATLSREEVIDLLRAAGQERALARRAAALQEALTAPALTQPAVVAAAYGAQVRALATLIGTLTTQIASLEAELAASLMRHPDAEIILSLPRLGTVLGARVLAEFGDDPTRYPNSKARKCYAGTAPVTRTSGKSWSVVRRHAGNKLLTNACYLWASNAKLTSYALHPRHGQGSPPACPARRGPRRGQSQLLPGQHRVLLECRLRSRGSGRAPPALGHPRRRLLDNSTRLISRGYSASWKRFHFTYGQVAA
jgi:transposase